MLNLTLVRHAKSSWNSSNASTDHDRPLNNRGLADAPFIAKTLIERGLSPKRCLVSSATRTQETVAAFIEAGLVSKSNVHFDQTLYLASPDTILNVVQEDFLTQKKPPQHVMVIAHNPGIEILADNLSAFKTGPMPTCAVAHFSIDANDFALINTANAHLEFFITPKALR